MRTAKRVLKPAHVRSAPANIALMQTAGKHRLSYTAPVPRDLWNYDAVKCAMRAIVPTPQTGPVVSHGRPPSALVMAIWTQPGVCIDSSIDSPIVLEQASNTLCTRLFVLS